MKKLNFSNQDKTLINNIINKNYYDSFKKDTRKNLCLTFYYNYKFNSANYDPNTIIP